MTAASPGFTRSSTPRCARPRAARRFDVARAFLSAGARWIQLRCKDLASGAFLDLANRSSNNARAAGAIADHQRSRGHRRDREGRGLHVGRTDLSPADARPVIGPSTDTRIVDAHARAMGAALSEPISYVAIGPVFGSGTKDTGYEAVGLDGRAEASSAAAAKGLPTVAIGGITIDNAVSVIEAGAASVAMISDLSKEIRRHAVVSSSRHSNNGQRSSRVDRTGRASR